MPAVISGRQFVGTSKVKSVEALVQELEFPVLSKKGFRKKLRGVMPHILEVIKAESKKAV